MNVPLLRVRPPAPGRRGAVLVLTLLALLLLSAAVFFIFNVGTHLQKRTETQNAADATVAAGAGWVARTLNLVSANHVEITKLLAQVQVLDAVPEALGDALLDHQTALDAVERQRVRGVGADVWLRPALSQVADELRTQVAVLEELDAVLITGPEEAGRDEYDIAQLTSYNYGQQRGALWEAMLALDEINRTAMTELGVLAQNAAVQAAETNQNQSGAHGFLVPFLPQLPWEIGEFGDFAQPLREGLLPEDLDDTTHARGPFDVLFGFRAPRVRVGPNDYGEPQQTFGIDSDYPLNDFRRRGQRPVRGEVIGYRTYSPYRFYVSQLDDAEAEALGESSNPDRDDVRSWFAERVRARAGVKFNWLLSRMDETQPRRGASLSHPTPAWDRNYDAWVARSNLGEDPRELLVYLEFAPVREGTAPNTLEDWGLYPFNGPGPVSVDEVGQKVADHIWRIERRLVDRPANGGEPVFYVQYTYLVWCAFDRGSQSTTIRDPNNFGDDDPLPAPLRFIEDRLNHDDPAARNEFLRFFAAAEQPAYAPFWSALFDGEGDGERPAARVTATASAVVFNNHSWDLWTQMWHAQLVPVEDLDGWLTLMRQTGAVTDDIPRLNLNSRQIGRTFRYLESVAPLLEVVNDVGETQ